MSVPILLVLKPSQKGCLRQECTGTFSQASQFGEIYFLCFPPIKWINTTVHFWHHQAALDLLFSHSVQRLNFEFLHFIEKLKIVFFFFAGALVSSPATFAVDV